VSLDSSCVLLWKDTSLAKRSVDVSASGITSPRLGCRPREMDTFITKVHLW
jgi:hypothetical protein